MELKGKKGPKTIGVSPLGREGGDKTFEFWAGTPMTVPQSEGMVN